MRRRATCPTYVRTMERAMIAALADEGIEAEVREGLTGVWAGESQDRLDRRARVARRDHARLRGERRRRPPAVRVDRAVRDRGRADDLACSRRPGAPAAMPLLPQARGVAVRARRSGCASGSVSPRARLRASAAVAEQLGAGMSARAHRPAPAPTPAARASSRCPARCARSASASRRGSRCRRPGGAALPRAAPDDRRRGPAHGLPGGGLPEHRRVLAARHGHVHDPRRHLHAPLRLLQRQDRQADATTTRSSRCAWRSR